MGLFKKPNKQTFLSWRGYLAGIVLVALATWLKYLAQPQTIPTDSPILYVAAIVPTAIFFGLGPSIMVCVLSVLAFEYFFIPPVFLYSGADIRDIPMFLIFLLIGVIISFLSSNLRSKTKQAIEEVDLRKQSEMDLIKYRDHLEDLVKQRTTELEEANSDLKKEIAERKQAEAALAIAKDELETRVKERTRELGESEEKYRLLVENANEAVVVFQDGRLNFFNSKGVDLSGYSREELASMPFAELIHPEDRKMVIERHQKRLRAEAVPIIYEFRIKAKDGSVKWVEINAVLITWEGKPAVLGLLTDITGRKTMEQALQDYAQRIIQVQEEERKRIAFELHDDTAQYLSILKLQLDSILNSGMIQSPEILKKLKYLEKDAGRAVDDVRRYSHELRPGVLEHLGLQAALEQMAEDINKLNQIAVEFNVDGEEPKTSEQVKLGYFRIAQEAMNNCRKHSKASKVSISLKFQNNQLSMAVRDNGTGFDMQEAATRSSLKGSLGLMSMQERAKLIGANLRIESEPGKGTIISVEKAIGDHR